jgi:S1-C subfamily serine protease
MTSGCLNLKTAERDAWHQSELATWLKKLLLIVCITSLFSPARGAEIISAGILVDGKETGAGVYLRDGLVITASHLVSATEHTMSARLTGLIGLPLEAKIIKHGSFQEGDVDLSLLRLDIKKLPARIATFQEELCKGPPWPGDPVIVVDAAGKVAHTTIVSPAVIPRQHRAKYPTLIGDVATTGNSGSGVFDLQGKCLLGIMSVKFSVAGKDVAKYFIPVPKIQAFLPDEFK